MRTLHYIFLVALIATIITAVSPYLTTRQDWLFVSGAVSLIGAIITRLSLDQKETS